MIVGMGQDLLNIERFERVFRLFPERTARRLLSLPEMSVLNYQTIEDKSVFLAKIFCLKEAASKALGTGFRQGITWHHFVYSKNNLGQPRIQLAGMAMEWIQQKFGNHHIYQAHCSLSDSFPWITAVVIIEKI